MNQQALIQIRGLSFRYPGTNREVLRIPALDVAGRGMTAITGPSGVGKSTLIELLAGTLRSPYEGSVTVLGEEWQALTSDARRQRQIRRIGLIPQDYGLLTDRTPAQMLDQDLADSGVSRPQRHARIESALTATNLADCHDRLIGTMSGGQRQRVAIARMLARNVELVIADEPTANLDPQLTESTMGIFRRLSQTVPVVIITHDPAVAAACDRTILLQATVPDQAPAAVLLRAPRRARRALLTIFVALVIVGVGALSGAEIAHHRKRHSHDALAASVRHSRRTPPPVTSNTVSPFASSNASTDASSIASMAPSAASPAATALTPAPIDPPYSPAGRSPVDVVYRYYSAINSKNWPVVWALGGDNLGEPYATMVRGYADTANDVPYFTSIDGDQLQLVLLAYETSGIAQLYNSTLTISDGAIVHASQKLDYTDPNQGYALLAGHWTGHDRDLQVTPGGTGVISFRTFDQCDSIAAGCDQFIGNQIINGGLIIFHLTDGQANEAVGRVTTSTVSTPSNMSLKTSLKSDTVSLSMFNNAPFCGLTSPANKCGA